MASGGLIPKGTSMRFSPCKTFSRCSPSGYIDYYRTECSNPTTTPTCGIIWKYRPIADGGIGPLMVKRIRYGSSLCGRIFATIFSYVFFLPRGFSRAWMKCIVFVPAFTAAEPCARRPISFDADPSHDLESAPILRWRYSNAVPVSSHIT